MFFYFSTMSKFVALPCSGCEDGEAASVCSRCKTARYCSRQCQRKDWKYHKKRCNKYYTSTSLYAEAHKAVHGYCRNSIKKKLKRATLFEMKIADICFSYFYRNEYFVQTGSSVSASDQRMTITKMKNDPLSSAFGALWIPRNIRKVCKWTFRVNKLGETIFSRFGIGGCIEFGFVNFDYNMESISKLPNPGFVYFYCSDGRNGWSWNAMRATEGDIVTMILDLVEFKLKVQINDGDIRTLQEVQRDDDFHPHIGSDLKMYKMAVSTSCVKVSSSVTLLSHSISESIIIIN